MSLQHLAIIPDGNRRWARDRGLPTLEGHRRGYEKFKEIGLAALERGVKFFTIWGFSTENWKRSTEEVGYLMDLILRALTVELEFYKKHQVRLRVIGRREGLAENIQKAIRDAEAATAHFTNGQLNLAINYGGRAEIIDGLKQIISEGHKPEDITEELISSKLWTAGMPDPDLILRTSGEQRLSGYMAWPGTYSELAFVEKHWPDFSVEDLDALLKEFAERERRFGA